MTLDEWWLTMTGSSSPNRKAIASLVVLACWEVWNERNARVFRNKHMPPTVVLANIKRELKLWVATGAKRVSVMIPG
jgi:hypothetical protein